MHLTDALVAPLVRVAERHPEIQAVYLFGSQATGTATPDSDVDVGVLYASPQPLARTLELEDAVAQVLGRRVDVVDVTTSGAFLALEIVRGARVFCRDSTAADLFELYVLGRAGDLLPYERERQALLGLSTS